MLFLVVPAVCLVLCAAFLARARADVDEAYVREWAAARGLTLTTANHPLVWWYLRNARMLRTSGVLAGIGLPPLFALALGYEEATFLGGWWLYVFGGHLTGALYAEVALQRPEQSGTRIASLERRELNQYLPAALRFAPAAITVVLAGFVTIGWSTGDLDAVTESDVSAALVGAVAVTVVIAVAQRWIVRRPQPFAEVDLVEADDAIRSQSVHSLAGSGSAMVLSLLLVVCTLVGAHVDGALRVVTTVVAIGAYVLAIAACFSYGNSAWRVRRTSFLRPEVPAS